MLEQKQLFLHRPEEGIVGDCFRTCLACVLDLPVSGVPHFYQELFNFDDPEEPVAEQVHARTNAWLAAKYGLRFVEIAYSLDIEPLREYISWAFKNLHVIIGCNSKNGGHSVVMRNKDYMWDPAIDNSGCVGPMDDGYYWIGFIVKEL
jgi:hypothetical protein